MTYTLGPWILEEDETFYWIWNSTKKIVICHLLKENYPKSKEESLANALLLTASPRLLEACKGLLDYVEILIKERREIGLPDDHPDFEWPAVIEARAAIAATEGREE